MKPGIRIKVTESGLRERTGTLVRNVRGSSWSLLIDGDAPYPIDFSIIIRSDMMEVI